MNGPNKSGKNARGFGHNEFITKKGNSITLLNVSPFLKDVLPWPFFAFAWHPRVLLVPLQTLSYASFLFCGAYLYKC